MYSIRPDATTLLGKVDDIAARQLPFAVMLAINDASDAVRRNWVSSIPSVFQQPTPPTLSAVLYKKATKQNLEAFVYLRDEASKGTPPVKWLSAPSLGGARQPKPYELRLRERGILGPSEFTVAAKGFPLDSFGNIPANVIRTVLADVSALRDPLDRSNAESRRKRRNRRNIGKRATYFYLRESRGRLPRGIYQRIRFASGSAVRMVLAIVSGAPRYTARFNPVVFSESVFHREFREALPKRLAQARATARK